MNFREAANGIHDVTAIENDECSGGKQQNAYLLKCPLKYAWSFWIMESQANKIRAIDNWAENLRCLQTVTTVVEFWAMMNYLKLPYDLDVGTDYYFFKQGIHPSWEHPENVSGGNWSCIIRHSSLVNSVWMNTLLALIGDQFKNEKGEDFGQYITGLRIHIRSSPSKADRKDKISLWTKDGKNEFVQINIGRLWKRFVFITGNPFSYELHDYKSVMRSNTKGGTLYSL